MKTVLYIGIAIYLLNLVLSVYLHDITETLAWLICAILQNAIINLYKSKNK